MTTWNHRVMKFNDPLHEEWLEICEVYYDEADKPFLYTEKAVGVAGETIDELRVTLRRMEKALDEPILTPMDFKKSETSDGRTVKEQS